MSDLFPQGFFERYLWDDPLPLDPRGHSGAVLRAEDIYRYVNEFDLLINRADFIDDNLKGASYTMSPHPSEGWILDTDGHQRTLEIREDSRGAHYVVPDNALVYIRLREQLRLPFYVIGRHNLKIDYVYQGLLLGTGPQVDPGYIGRIYIPLHNLTRQSVRVYINESFVSIDFVRTSPIHFDRGVPETWEQFYALYKSDKRPIKREKLLERDNLSSYLNGAQPSSSLAAFVSKLKELADASKEESEKAKNLASDVRSALGSKKLEVGIAVGFAVTFLGALWGYFGIFQRGVDSISKEVQSLRESAMTSTTEARGEFSKALDAKLADSRKEIELLRTELRSAESEMARLKKESEELRKELEKK